VWITYLESVGKINEHNSARRLLASSGIEADSSDHVHATALDEVVVCSKFEYLDPAHDSRLGNPKLTR
jgi:hypothetical protein